MKNLFLLLSLSLFLFSSCATSGSVRQISGEWKNKLTCDDGLRIDEGPGVSHQIVLFDNAAQHFIQAGAFEKNQLNENDEIVRGLQPNRDVYLATLHDGQLVMPTNLNRSDSNFTVRWLPYGNSSHQGTEYVFHRCH